MLKSRGFTLIELVLALTLTAVLSIPAALLVTQTLRAALQARDMMTGLSLARAELERLDALNNFFDTDLLLTCPSGTAVTTTMLNYNATPYDVLRTVSCQSGNCCTNAINSQGLMRIEVTVRRNGTTQTVCRLRTYRAKNVYFGG